MTNPRFKPWMTATLVFAVALSAIALLGIGWGVIEATTLADDVPGNHITATFRAIWAQEPGALLLVMLVLSNFVTGTLMYIGGHIFWRDSARKEQRIRELEAELAQRAAPQRGSVVRTTVVGPVRPTRGRR